jgi:hypothetical protein
LLQHLASQQQASRLHNLTAPDALQAAEMLASAAQQPEQLQQQADSKQQQLKQHPGVQFLCQWLARVLPELEAAQQLQLLDCLAAVAQAGLGEQQRQHLCLCIMDVKIMCVFPLFVKLVKCWSKSAAAFWYCSLRTFTHC